MRRASDTRHRARRTAAQRRKLIERFDRSGPTRGNRARERPLQGSVSIRRFAVAVNFPARRHRLGRCTVNVTAIPDLAMCGARAIVVNQAQRLSCPVNQRQPAREILVVIQVLPEVDPVDDTVFGLRGEVPLSMPAGLLLSSGAWIRYPFRR